MNQFVRPSWIASRAGSPVAFAYIIAAALLGAGGDRAALFIAGEVSPMSSASAVAILSAIASGMMALTAIAFSLIVLAVQYASTAYSPRLIQSLGGRPFLAHALGIFTGTFLYALLAIRTVDRTGSAGINTSVVFVSLLWLLVSVVILVALLPRIRGSTMSDVLVALSRGATAAADRVYPSDGVAATSVVAQPTDLPVTQTLMHEQRPMYLVGLDVERLVRNAADANALMVIPLAIGDSVLAAEPLAIVHGATRSIDERALRGGIWLANERHVENDPAYAIRLLVDIGIRALSPSVNDPTTAVTVLDELDGLLRLLGQRSLENNAVADQHGVVRLVREVPSWDDLCALALTEIHQFGRGSIQVERRLATMLRNLPEVLPPQRRAAIERFSRWQVQSLASVIDDARGWIDPLTTDRQGIGHAGNGSR